MLIGTATKYHGRRREEVRAVPPPPAGAPQGWLSRAPLRRGAEGLGELAQRAAGGGRLAAVAKAPRLAPSSRFNPQAGIRVAVARPQTAAALLGLRRRSFARTRSARYFAVARENKPSLPTKAHTWQHQLPLRKALPAARCLLQASSWRKHRVSPPPHQVTRTRRMRTLTERLERGRTDPGAKRAPQALTRI
jgi:hypothetical protein